MILLFKHFILIPEFFFCVCLIYLILYGIIISTTLKIKRLIIKPIINLSILVLIFSTILFYNNLNSISLSFNYFFNSFTIDYFSEISKIVIAFFTIFCFCMFRFYLPTQKINKFEYIIIILLAVLGVFLLCSANDLLTAYLAIELQSLAFYLLASFKKNSSFSVNAGLKYFILGSIASCLFLFSCSFIYGLTGTIYLEEIFTLFDLSGIFSLIGCFDFFLKQMFYFNKFGFCYSFDTDFENFILDIYFNALELSFVYTQLFQTIGCNFEKVIIVLNKFFYHSNMFSFNGFNVNSVFDTIYLFSIRIFAVESYSEYVDCNIWFYFTMFIVDLLHLFDYFLSSFFSLNFFFISDLKNVFILKLFEFSVLLLHLFRHYSFLAIFSVDLIFNDLIGIFENQYFLNFFLMDSIYLYSKFFHLLDTIIFASLIYVLLFSLFFKLAVVPFNLWLPDIYEGSLSSTTAFFAIIPKLSIFIFFFRLLNYGMLNDLFNFQYFMLISGGASIIYGSFIAIEERKLKSLLAFSAISNIGFILLALSSLTLFSNAIIFCYFIVYMLANLLIWFVILTYTSINSIKLKKFNKELSNFSNFYKSNKTMSFLFSLTLFSIAGLPPFIGFLAKFGIFLTTLETSNYTISIISILSSVVAIFYYLRIVKIIFFENKDTNISLFFSRFSFFYAFFIGLFLLLIVLFIYPNLIYLVFFKFCYTFF